MTIKKQSGIGLVELIIAVALSAIIIAGILQVFLSNREAFNMTQSLIRAQQNGRFAINFLTTNIRQSGNFGCVPESNSETGNIQSHTPLITNFNAIQLGNPGFLVGTENGAENGPNEFDDPDTLVLLQLESTAGRVTAAAGGSLTIAGGDADWAPGDFFLVSNCVVGDFIQSGAGTDNAQIVDATAGLRTSQYAILNDVSTVSEIRQLAFTLTDEALLVDENANFDGTGAQELVDGIENIQYQFGVDLDGDFVADFFADFDDLAANQIDDIIAVNVSILTVSNTEVTSSPQTIAFNGKEVVMGDNRLRKVFNSTTALRNRLN